MRLASTTCCIIQEELSSGSTGISQLVKYSPSRVRLLAITSQLGANRNGSTSSPASAYSVRMSPFHSSVRCKMPIASRTSSRRSSRGIRRSGAIRSNCMASPMPNSSENRASAFMETARARPSSMARLKGESPTMAHKSLTVSGDDDPAKKVVPASCALGVGRNCWKIEIRNSNTTLIAMTPKRARPRRMSMAGSRSPPEAGPVGLADPIVAVIGLRTHKQGMD